MFKQRFVFEAKGKEDRICRFDCDPASPLGELIDASYEFRKILLDQLNSQQKKDKVEDKKSKEKAPKPDEKKSEDKCEKECKKEEGKA